MTNEARAMEIVEWFRNISDCTSPTAMWSAEDELGKRITTAISEAEGRGYEKMKSKAVDTLVAHGKAHQKVAMDCILIADSISKVKP